ncbi:MAG: Flp pilus assembly complex ATPase component TadA, partial [Candidatus Omnitrophica bacterium]|nr:Flp pilus assembly complex ATPase component TadA [Candidatus Omnitrophota bacterium]
MRDDIRKLLSAMPANDASDMHIGVNSPMHYRIDGRLVEIEGKALSGDEARDIIHSLLTPEQLERFEKDKELDFSLSIEGVARYRGNIFLQRGEIGCAIRLIPLSIKGISECGLPEKVVGKFCEMLKGLVLVTGATGSGKSTTLAAIVDEINRTRDCHIVTVEDPIEFVHDNNMAIVDQRQLLEDTHS